MKQRILSWVAASACCISLCTGVQASAVPAAHAIEPEFEALSFTDIAGHWAADDILRAAEAGLVKGIGDSRFDPDGLLNRGMFVTIIGRLLKIDPTLWAVQEGMFPFTDVPSTSYYAPYVNWAVHTGITTGTSAFTFSPDATITRQEMATFLARIGALTCYKFPTPTQEEASTANFADADSISGWAKDAVTLLQGLSILKGHENAEGEIIFDPTAAASSAQGCAVLNRTAEALILQDESHWVEPTDVFITSYISTLSPQESVMMQAEVQPRNASNPNIIWTSSNPAVISITPSGVMSWQGAGTAILTAMASNGVYTTIAVTAKPNETLAYKGESYRDKCIRIFGKEVDDPRDYYRTNAEAETHQVSIPVDVWDLDENGEKYTRTFYLQVHKNIAPTVKQIFREIYALPSQPPIHTLGGFRESSESEHRPGLAIDINWEENYFCNPDGSAITGKYFKPGQDPYSIPVKGEIEQIFEKYGFTRGIYWRNGTKDYMHFSFFGT